MQLKGSGFEARHMACADDTIPRPVVEVLFLKSFRRAVTVIGIGATRIRWERRTTKKRTYEKVADYGCSRFAHTARVKAYVKVAALTTVPPTSLRGIPNGEYSQNGGAEDYTPTRGSTLLEMIPSKQGQ